LSHDAFTAIIPSGMEEGARVFQYSPAVRVPAGDLLFISGQVGLDAHGCVPEEPDEQFMLLFRNLESVVTTAGTCLDKIVELTSFHTSMDHVDLFKAIKERFFTTPPFPAWSIIGISALGRPGLLAEMRAVARL
jgi:enamine deaminase RidA (YjgF/YER057c/UK114 family)